MAGHPTADYTADELLQFYGILCGYPAKRLGPRLAPADIDELRSMILNPENYATDDYRCTFAPEYAFTFYAGADSVSVVLATECLYVTICDSSRWGGGGPVTRECGAALQQFVMKVLYGNDDHKR